MECVGPFFSAVFRHWKRELLGGVLIGALALFSELTGVSVPPRIYELTAALVLFYAMFLAWRDEYVRAQRLLEEKKQQPPEESPLMKAFLDPQLDAQHEHASALRQYTQALETDRTRKESLQRFNERANRQIAQHYTQGRDLLNRRVDSNEELEKWKSDLETWRSSVLEGLSAIETVAFDKLFTKHDHAHGHPDALNRVHGDLRGELSVQLERLNGILQKRNTHV